MCFSITRLPAPLDEKIRVLVISKDSLERIAKERPKRVARQRCGRDATSAGGCGGGGRDRSGSGAGGGRFRGGGSGRRGGGGDSGGDDVKKPAHDDSNKWDVMDEELGPMGCGARGSLSHYAWAAVLQMARFGGSGDHTQKLMQERVFETTLVFPAEGYDRIATGGQGDVVHGSGDGTGGGGGGGSSGLPPQAVVAALAAVRSAGGGHDDLGVASSDDLSAPPPPSTMARSVSTPEPRGSSFF